MNTLQRLLYGVMLLAFGFTLGVVLEANSPSGMFQAPQAPQALRIVSETKSSTIKNRHIQLFHPVEPGDTVESIAKSWNMEPFQIRLKNKLARDEGIEGKDSVLMPREWDLNSPEYQHVDLD